MKELFVLCAAVLIVAAASVCFADEGFNFADIASYNMVDLSHLQEAKMPVDPSLQLPKTEFFARIGEGSSYNLEVLSYCPHTGTHMDAPFHINNSFGTVETINPLVLIGPACVVKLNVPEGSYGITVADIQGWEKDHGEIKKGDAVLFHTGHDALWNDFEKYLAGYPYLTKEVAQYMVDKGVRYIAVESISPDTVEPESHTILLGNGVEIVENICNLGEIKADRCFTVGTFPKSAGNTGVWVRILAFYK